MTGVNIQNIIIKECKIKTSDYVKLDPKISNISKSICKLKIEIIKKDKKIQYIDRIFIKIIYSSIIVLLFNVISKDLRFNTL